MPLHLIKQSIQTAADLVQVNITKIIQIPWSVTVMQMVYNLFPFWEYTPQDK
jgi:hypothetical protein